MDREGFVASVSPPQLQAVVPVEAEFGGVGGDSCTLTAVELWSSGFIAQLLWMPESPVHRMGKEAVERGEPREWLARWTFADDVGGDYLGVAGGASQTGPMVLEDVEVRSPLPPEADVLSIGFQHDDGVSEARISLGDGTTLAAPKKSAMTPPRGGRRYYERMPSAQPPRYSGTIPVGVDLGEFDNERVWLVAVDMIDPYMNLRFAHALGPDADPLAVPRIEWAVSDDLGTAYEQGAGRGWSSSGVGRDARRWFWPAPPDEASVLTVTGHWEGRELQHLISLDRCR